MTKTGVSRTIFLSKPALSKVASAVVLSMAASLPAQAFDFQWGDDWEGRFDSTFSAGASMRTEAQDKDMISKTNNLGFEPPDATATGLRNPIILAGVMNQNRSFRGAWSSNGDDGNQNFKRGETFSKIVKGSHEFSLKYKDSFGVFASGLYFYDFELMDEHRPFAELDDEVLDQQGADAKFLSAYTYFNFDLFERPSKFSVGKQVINWGESTFIQHGISEANQPLDVTKLRVPGAEIKEAFLPLGSALFSIGLTDTIDVDVYAQYEWDHLQIDGVGTYFSSTDILGLGAQEVYLGFGQTADFGSTDASSCTSCGFRVGDRDADDSGQYGAKLSWYAEDLNETEFGFYYVNYHNRRPIISAYAAGGFNPAYPQYALATKGFVEYLEDIELYGVSFNTTVQSTGTAVSGEITVRQDEPLQIDDVELLFSTLEPVGRVPSGTSQIPAGTLPGGEISGYRLYDTVQAQTTFTQLFGPSFGADEFTLVAELGMNYIQDMPDQDELRLDAPGTVRSGNPARAGNGFGYRVAAPFTCVGNVVGTARLQCEGVETNQFATAFSWGYRLVGKLDYNSLFAGVNVSPRVFFSHDVNGNTPVPIANFVESRKALGMGVGFDYQNRWNLDFSYNSYFGGETGADGLSDRDFVSMTVKYSI